MKSKKRTSHTRSQRIERKRNKRNNAHETLSNDPFYAVDAIVERTDKRPLNARTEAQGHYICSILNNIITFGVGPAGTGKSYVAAGIACDLLKEGKIEKIIITRPGVEAGEKFGFLPGEIEDKYAPFLEPFRDILNERLGRSFVDYCIRHKKIEARPLAFMRGTTFRDAFVILDEAQNTTPTQMEMFLTRIGENVTVVVDGDIRQKDVSGKSGLADAIKRLEKLNMIGVVEFTRADVVRSGIVKQIIGAYSE